MKKNLKIIGGIMIVLSILLCIYHIPCHLSYHYSAIDSNGNEQSIQLKGTVTRYIFKENVIAMDVTISGTKIDTHKFVCSKSDFCDDIYIQQGCSDDNTELVYTFIINENYTIIEFYESDSSGYDYYVWKK